MGWIEQQVNIGPRFPGTDAHKSLQDRLEKEMKRVAHRHVTQGFDAYFEGKPVTLKNFFAFFGPEEGTTVLIGTHYDVRRFANRDEENPQAYVPGANDGASGTAVLLQLAEHLATTPPPQRVVLAFFDAEDQGDIEGKPYSLGARRFAEDPPFSLPDFAVIVDMVCYADAKFYYEKNAHARFPQAYEALWDLARSFGFLHYVKEAKHAVFDDHIPLIRAGVPSLLVIGMDYPYWHTTEDTPDKCRSDTLLSVGETLLRFVHERRIVPGKPEGEAGVATRPEAWQVKMVIGGPDQ